MPVPPPFAGIPSDTPWPASRAPSAPSLRAGQTRGDSTWTGAGPAASPRFVHAALSTVGGFRAGGDGDGDERTVSDWLAALGLERLSPNFEEHGVTADMLLTLSADDLRRDLGVTRLHDRRVLMDGIAYLRQLHDPERPPVPEDGRILTHLMMERALLAWASLSLAAQTLAVASLRDPPKDASLRRAHTAATVAAQTWGVVVIGAAAYRHLRLRRFVEAPGAKLMHGEAVGAIFVILACAAIAIAAYAVARFRGEELALAAVLAI